MSRAAAPTGPRFEHGPVLGVGTPAPRLSWQVSDAEPGYAQAAYEVEVDGGAFRVGSSMTGA